MSNDFLLKQVETPERTPDGVAFTVVGLAATTLPHTPGWLTGETPEAQGIETGMPNLPRDLRLPGLEETRRRCAIRVVGPDTIRVTIAPESHRLWSEPATWPGILVADTNGDTAHEVVETGQGLVIGFGDSRLEVAH